MGVLSNVCIDVSTLDEPSSLDSEVDAATWLLEHEGLLFHPDRHLENCGLNCHVEVPISTHRRKLGGWVGPHFE